MKELPKRSYTYLCVRNDLESFMRTCTQYTHTQARAHTHTLIYANTHTPPHTPIPTPTPTVVLIVRVMTDLETRENTLQSSEVNSKMAGPVDLFSATQAHFHCLDHLRVSTPAWILTQNSTCPRAARSLDFKNPGLLVLATKK